LPEHWKESIIVPVYKTDCINPYPANVENMVSYY